MRLIDVWTDSRYIGDTFEASATIVAHANGSHFAESIRGLECPPLWCVQEAQCCEKGVNRDIGCMKVVCGQRVCKAPAAGPSRTHLGDCSR